MSFITEADYLLSARRARAEINSVPPGMRQLSLAIGKVCHDNAATFVFLAFVVATYVACHMPAQNDTWWHLRAGQDIWAGQSVFVDRYSFTRPGAEWVNREWLSQALFYGLYAAGGFPLLTAALAMCAVAAVLVTASLFEGPARKTLIAVLALLCTTTPQWALRPQVLSFLTFAITLYLLERGRERWLPALFLVWANLHGGVVLGAVVLVVVAVAGFVTKAASHRRVATFAATSLAATLCTPLGVRLWTNMPEAIRRMRGAGISEFQPLQANGTAEVAFLILAALFAVLFVLARPWVATSPARHPLVVASLATTAAGFISTRNTAAAALLLVLAIGRLSRQFDHWFEGRVASHPRVNATLLASAAALSLVLTAVDWARGGSTLHWQPLSGATITALNDCQGNVYNRIDDGGYLIWFTRSHPVLIDSRFDPYDSALIGEHIQVEATGQYRELFARLGIRCALTAPDSRLSIDLRRDGWTADHTDRDWVVLRNN